MTKLQALEQLYLGHSCGNCQNQPFCKKKVKYSVCKSWIEKNDLISQMLKVVRLGYPTMIKDEIFKEWAIKETPAPTPYINYTYTKKEENETT